MERSANEATEENNMVKYWKTAIPELTGKEKRNVYVYLPETYEEDEEKRYPVMYMFDGHNVFFDSHATYGKSWGMKEYMDSTETEMIIVAAECNHSPDNGRLSEYSPYSFTDPEFGTVTGRGKITMEWMVNTLKKDIDERFRTLPGRAGTYIAGSSMGGLMSLYAVLEYNEIFRGAAALSPSLWAVSGEMEKLAREAKLSKNTVIYMDYGSRELLGQRHMERYFSRMTQILIDRRVNVTSRIVPGGSHCEASWERQIPYFMNTLLY